MGGLVDWLGHCLADWLEFCSVGFLKYMLKVISPLRPKVLVPGSGAAR